MYNVDPIVTLSVIQRESNFNSNSIGMHGEVGLMQLLPKYFDYKGLKTNEVNIRLGVKHLSMMQKNCKHQQDLTWLVCYNRGLVGGAKLSKPTHDEYYLSVKENYRSNSWLKSYLTKYNHNPLKH
jgi:soluble lytic murein transglycosylase-like protein